MTTTAHHIDPTEEQIAALVDAAETKASPVTMINLLRFDGERGRDSYLRYAAEVGPHLERVGASLVYGGNTAQTLIGDEDTAWWDAIVVVRYPSRAKFLEMVLDEGYQAIAQHRAAALTTSGLVATDEWTELVP